MLGGENTVVEWDVWGGLGGWWFARRGCDGIKGSANGLEESAVGCTTAEWHA